MNLLLQSLERYIYDDTFKSIINSDNSEILVKGYEQNKELIKAFWNKYYSLNIPKIMICGINPGRNGAGITGIPFLDFKSLSSMNFDVKGDDSEPSAEFFFEVVKRFGTDNFFNFFYVTNIASVGFTKNNKNLNYHDLPPQALQTVLSNFSLELDAVKPERIIALSVAVENTLNDQIKYKKEHLCRLPHPSWIMTYKRKEKEKWITKYTDMLEKCVAELNKTTLLN